MTTEQELKDFKHCGKCSEVKNRSEFHRNRCKPDGVQSHCKKCTNLLNKGSRDKSKEIPRTKVCIDCNEVKAASAFYANSASGDGLQACCKDCNKLRYQPASRAQRDMGAAALPEIAETRRQTVSRYNDSIVDALDDAYVRRKLVQQTGTPSASIPYEAIAAKRMQLLVEREAQEQLAKCMPLMAAKAELEDALAKLKQGKISPQDALAISASARDGINAALKTFTPPAPAQSELEV